jgi:hypothetical protein
MEPTITLHYIDKIHASMIETGKAVNRATGVMSFLAVLVLLLSSGLASMGSSISILGTTLEFNGSVALVATSWLLGITYVYLWGAAHHGYFLRQRILELYTRLGFNEARADISKGAHPIDYPDLLTVAITNQALSVGGGSGLQFIGTLIVLIVIAFVPLGAEYIALRMATKLMGHRVWIWSSYVFLILFMARYLIVVLVDYARLEASQSPASAPPPA